MTNSSHTLPPSSNGPAAAGYPVPHVVADALARLRYGDIKITIHDGRLVQVDVTERTRLVAPDR
jgi:hypothetical protein